MSLIGVLIFPSGWGLLSLRSSGSRLYQDFLWTAKQCPETPPGAALETRIPEDTENVRPSNATPAQVPAILGASQTQGPRVVVPPEAHPHSTGPLTSPTENGG